MRRARPACRVAGRVVYVQNCPRSATLFSWCQGGFGLVRIVQSTLALETVCIAKTGAEDAQLKVAEAWEHRRSGARHETTREWPVFTRRSHGTHLQLSHAGL